MCNCVIKVGVSRIEKVCVQTVEYSLCELCKILSVLCHSGVCELAVPVAPVSILLTDTGFYWTHY